MHRAIGFAVLMSVMPGAGTLAASAEVRDANLAPYVIADLGIARPLTDKPGNPTEGRKVAVGQQLGNCLACHKLPIPEEDFHGEIGPDLHGVGGRLTAAMLRLRIVDPKRVNPATSMPAFYKVDGLHRVIKNKQGQPMLTAQQVEDLVAYLLTLR
jgi:sulfur-oxidizing protein SoxX